MKENNSHNVKYFENSTMYGLYQDMDKWQKDSNKRFLSSTVQKDGGKYCCICLTNPSEVVIVGSNGSWAEVTRDGQLRVTN
ncbi:MAG: hypothetical protein HQ510_09700 [Candidatus Marinimicrobia bacterium]|nr:hypothetical protein [Candidatus Neomarinimicrobiota bacterium]